MASMFKGYTPIQRDRMNSIMRTVLTYKRITRNKLAQLLKLSPSSIIKYIITLNEMGFLRETGQEASSAGRKSTYIELNPDRGLNIAIVFNAYSFRGVLIDFSGQIIAEHFVEAHLNIPKDEALEKLYEIIGKLLSDAEKHERKIFGLGLALGGYLDPENGISHEFLYSTDWYDVPLRELVETRFNIPCFLVNDANAYVMGDKFYGHGVGEDNFIVVKMDEGIGMGIVMNGEVYLGENNYSGEFGHNNIQGNERLCYCGHTGCLETVCSKNFILSECRAGLEKGVYSEIRKLQNGNLEKIEIERVIEAANNGDRFARNIFEQVGENVGYKLSDIVNVLNPKLIIFRGSVIAGNTFLFETIERVLRNQVLRHIAASLEIKYSQTAENIDVKGINSIILMDYFTKESRL